MLSVIIPSRNQSSWPFTQKTIDDLFKKPENEIEVIIVLDGYMPDPPLKERKNLIIIHNIESKGMRQGINMAASIAKGKYIMKCDDHCAFGQGYDKILSEDCDENWLSVPSRYSLNEDNWLNGEDGKLIKKYGPIEYLYLTYPYNLDEQFGFGLHGKKWRGENGYSGSFFTLEKKRKHILIDDMLSCQGSCWFMHKKYFEYIGKMDEGYHQHQEAEELVFKTWLSGGRCIINKKTWYAHLHKGKRWRRGYFMGKSTLTKSIIYSTDMWMNNKWSGQTKKLKWLIDKFWPLELWPEDWDNPERWKNYNYNIWFNTNEIQKKLNSDFISSDDIWKNLQSKL